MTLFVFRLLLLRVLDEVEIRLLDGVEGIVLMPRLRTAVRKGCRIAGCGFSRRSGSQIRHFAIKSTNNSSSHRKTCASVLVPGRRRRPLEFTTGRGAPVESDGECEKHIRRQSHAYTPKKSRFRELRLIKSLSGKPKTSMMHDNCSCSFSPGKMGYPV